MRIPRARSIFDGSIESDPARIGGIVDKARPYQSTPPPPPDAQAMLLEGEYGTGLRTLDGQPTQSHQGLAAEAGRLRDQLGLLGRLAPTGPIVEAGMLLGRPFRDAADGTDYVVVVNRNVEAAVAIHPAVVGATGPLTDVFTGAIYEAADIGAASLPAGSGTLLRRP
jgi:hypothetical protein